MKKVPTEIGTVSPGEECIFLPLDYTAHMLARSHDIDTGSQRRQVDHRHPFDGLRNRLDASGQAVETNRLDGTAHLKHTARQRRINAHSRLRGLDRRITGVDIGKLGEDTV